MARSNMDKKKADEEIRRKEVQIQDLTAKYQSLQSSHMRIVNLKDELEQIYTSKYNIDFRYLRFFSKKYIFVKKVHDTYPK